MPYIPPEHRPGIDDAVDALADKLSEKLIAENVTAEISEYYHKVFMAIAGYIRILETAEKREPECPAEKLAEAIFTAALVYEQQGGWLGELNYAVTRLVQAVPYKMVEKGAWTEALRYWLYAETVGALVTTSYEIHADGEKDWISNGLAGVFEDIKDEYKRRVNTSYEAHQIVKSGDCYEKSPYRTQLVDFETGGVKGWIEVMLPKQEI